MQIKTTRYHFTPIRVVTIKKKKEKKRTKVGFVEKLKPLCTVGGNIKWSFITPKKHTNLCPVKKMGTGPE